MSRERYNADIAQYLGNDPYTAEYVYRELRKRWPQLNETTKVAYTEYREVSIAYLNEVNYFKDMVRVAKSGWRQLKYALFYNPLKLKTVKDGVPVFYSLSEAMDDPDERWKYTVILWRAIVNAPRPIFWRVAGRLFHRPKWTDRGMEWQPNPVMSKPRTDVVQIECFGWRWSAMDMGRIDCGYHATSDTLYIRR